MDGRSSVGGRNDKCDGRPSLCFALKPVCLSKHPLLRSLAEQGVRGNNDKSSWVPRANRRCFKLLGDVRGKARQGSFACMLYIKTNISEQELEMKTNTIKKKKIKHKYKKIKRRERRKIVHKKIKNI